ncbi:MAG: hypothetical protein J3Q66DRAFT_132963 [Benniella sp.]|nr:MAG: hypothetical protein J3Q66DRAFT_132963 [Benniella sp.]
MKIALTCLAALILPNAALAQHYACQRLFEGFAADVLHVAIFDSNKNIIMDESKNFIGNHHYTVTNSRGRYDWRRLSDKWSAAFDGQDWGSYLYQDSWNAPTSDYKIGCYDTTGSDYCVEPSLSEMKMRCLEKVDD